MNKIFNLACVSVTALLLSMTALLGQTAVGGKTRAELPEGVTRVALPGGSTYLELDAKVASFDLVTVDVKPDTKYRLTVRARIQDPSTVEVEIVRIFTPYSAVAAGRVSIRFNFMSLIPRSCLRAVGDSS